MKAIALVPGTTTPHLVDRPEPSISAPDEVKVRVLQVGICGTDRKQAAGERAEAPPGKSELVIGHGPGGFREVKCERGEAGRLRRLLRTPGM